MTAFDDLRTADLERRERRRDERHSRQTRNEVDLRESQPPYKVLDAAGEVAVESLYPRDALAAAYDRGQGYRAVDGLGRALVVMR